MTPPQGEDTPSKGAPGKAAAPGSKARITEEYTEVFSGAAVTTHRWAAREIHSLPYVERAHPDRRAKKTVSDARQVVGADELGAEGTTGEGVTIAILDTGIDYTHPALGGDIGPGNKVTGGYDLVNDDPDPMDGDGHGTHVAGIAAASGEGPGGEDITGVAPGAKLRAYKVLNDQGSGSFSTIIAGIERAVEDSVDVINMSLGGPGAPGGPLAQATDNASQAGVLPTVSAGNGGDYRTIGSPGVAGQAVTVGASNDSDQITSFSSRGPADGAFTVKPDVVAPGAGVRSTLPGGSFGRLSGTSMATPIVAGAAALALERNPDWGAQFLKGALMKSGVDIGEDIWTQGRGRIDAPSAAEARVVATPGILSFGLVKNGESTWTRIDTLKLRNQGDTDRTYQLSAGPSPAPGVNVNLTSSSVTVGAKDSALVPVTAEVNNGVAPFPDGTPPSFTGQVRATASQDTITVPYGMVKAPAVTLSLGEGESAIVLAHRSNGETAFFGAVRGKKTVLLPETGEYDFMARISGSSEPDTYVVREGVPATETSVLDIGPGQAQHTISMDFRTGDGGKVPLDGDLGDLAAGEQVILIHESGTGLRSFGPVGLQDGTQFSSMSDEYAFRGMSTGHTFENGRSKDYRVPYQFRGLSGDKTLASDPGDLQSVTYRLTDKVADRALFSHLIHRVVGRSFSFYWGSTNDVPAEEVEAPVVRELHVLPRPEETYDNFPGPVAGYDWYPAYRVLDYSDVTLAPEASGPADPTPIYQTGVPQPSGPDTTAFYRAFDFEEPIRRATDQISPIDIGGHPPRWEADATPGGILQSGTDSGWFEGPFAGVKLDRIGSDGTIQYRRYKGGSLVEEDVLTNSGNYTNSGGLGKRSLRDFEPGDSLVARFPHPAGGRDGNVELRFTPGTGNLGPRIDRFEIRSGGQVQDTLASSKANLVRTSFEDRGAVDSVEAFVRPAEAPAGGSSWTKVGSAKGGSLEATVPSTLETGHYALRIRGSGEEGGRVEQVADPAFWFSQREEEAPVPLASLTAVDTSETVSLRWSSSAGPDVSSYRIYRDTAPIDSSAGPSAAVALDTLETPANRYTDSTVQAGAIYYYRATTVDTDGNESAFSGEAVAALIDTTSPPVPERLTATAGGGEVSLKWEPVSSADLAGYRLYRSEQAVPDTSRVPLSEDLIAGSAFTDTSAEVGETYRYGATAVDTAGNESALSEGDGAYLQPRAIEVSVSRSFGDTNGPGEYRLVALPGTPDIPLTATIAGEEDSGWKAYRETGEKLRRYGGSDEGFTFRTGRGFWLTSRQDWTLEDSIETAPLRDSTTAIPLNPGGWTIVANPFGEAVSFRALSMANGGDLEALWPFEGAFNDTSAVFKSARDGRAYYLFNGDPSRDSLRVPHPALTGGRGGNSLEKEAPQALSAGTKSGASGTLSLSARPARESSENGPEVAPEAASTIRVGLVESGKTRSLRAPPNELEETSLRIVRGEREGPDPQDTQKERILMADRRSVEGQGETFQIRLTSRTEGPVQIQAHGINSLEGKSASLIDRSKEKAYDLRETRTVQVDLRDESRRLEVAIGTEGYVNQEADQILPEEVQLTSYPNPVKGQATVEYALPEAGEVVLAVYDALGRRVITLDRGRKEAGRHEVDLEASQLSSGIYFGQLVIGGKTHTQKITVVR